MVNVLLGRKDPKEYT